MCFASVNGRSLLSTCLLCGLFSDCEWQRCFVACNSSENEEIVTLCVRLLGGSRIDGREAIFNSDEEEFSARSQ